MSMASPFELTLGGQPGSDLRVISFRGREAISQLYRFDVRVTVSNASAGFEAAVLGRSARFTLLGGAAPRAIHGIVASIQAEGVFLHDRRVYSLRIVPRAWSMKRRLTSRIFQDKTTVDILRALLAERGLGTRLRITGQYPSRGYCVQYQESDYAFAARLLAEEGLFFYFDHPPTLGGDDSRTSMGLAEVFVLSDTAKYYPTLDGGESLAFRRVVAGGAVTSLENQVFHFAFARRLKARAMLLREYDYQRPAIEPRDAAVTADAAEGMVGPDGVSGPTWLSTEERELFASRTIREQTIYHHHGDHEDTQVEPKTAKVLLEQERARVAMAEGASFCRRLAPGRRVSLEGHEIGELDQAYAITSVEHEGYAPEVVPAGRQVYQNRFECVPAAVRFRPRRPKRRLHQVVETATVTGPESQEIHTDELGRVKVQFHWDLEGKRDDHSSCWIRVAQAWAGAGWGSQFIPRVGMEVVVTFLGGDIDRPLVTGCVYNGTHPVPFVLPASKTRSGIRSTSTPGGRKYNELSLEDAAGAEEIYIGAAANLRETVGEDHATTVARNQTLRVGGRQTVTVEAGISTSVGGDSAGTIAGSVTENVAKNKTVSIAGTLTENVGAQATIGFGDNLTLRVSGHFNTVVGGSDTGGAAGLFAQDAYSVGTDGQLTLRAKKGISIECGDSRIEIGPDRVLIEAKELVLSGTKAASLMGKGPALHLSDDAELVSKKIRIFSDKASLQLDEDANLRGDLIKLNCDDAEATESDEESAPQETKTLQLKLSDDKKKPYAGKKYRLIVEGKTMEGETDGDGGVSESVPKDARTADIELWIEKYPTGKRRRWTLNLPDDLPPVESLRGAQMRLANTGYFHGKVGDEIDDETRAALRRFQSDHDLLVTGEVDAESIAKLSELHGH